MTASREDIRDRMLDYLYEEMSEAEMRSFKESVALHPDLADELNDLVELRSEAAKLSETELPALVEANILRQARIHATDRASAHSSSWLERMTSWILHPTAAIALLAVVVAGVGLQGLEEDVGQRAVSPVSEAARELAAPPVDRKEEIEAPAPSRAAAESEPEELEDLAGGGSLPQVPGAKGAGSKQSPKDSNLLAQEAAPTPVGAASGAAPEIAIPAPVAKKVGKSAGDDWAPSPSPTKHSKTRGKKESSAMSVAATTGDSKANSLPTTTNYKKKGFSKSAPPTTKSKGPKAAKKAFAPKVQSSGPSQKPSPLDSNYSFGSQPPSAGLEKKKTKPSTARALPQQDEDAKQAPLPMQAEESAFAPSPARRARRMESPATSAPALPAMDRLRPTKQSPQLDSVVSSAPPPAAQAEKAEEWDASKSGLASADQSLEDSANQLFKKGDYQGAIPALKNALSQSPADPGLLSYRLADSYRRTQRVESAANAYKQLLDKHPTYGKRPQVLLDAAETFIAAGRIDDAKRTLDRLLKRLGKGDSTLAKKAMRLKKKLGSAGSPKQ